MNSQSTVPAPDLIPAAVQAEVGGGLYDERGRLTRGCHDYAASTGVFTSGWISYLHCCRGKFNSKKTTCQNVSSGSWMKQLVTHDSVLTLIVFIKVSVDVFGKVSRDAIPALLGYRD